MSKKNSVSFVPTGTDVENRPAPLKVPDMSSSQVLGGWDRSSDPRTVKSPFGGPCRS